jgi:hypothetical protein
MTCVTTGKIPHPTRDAALDAQKRLVYQNHAHGRDHRSAGLQVYPCTSCRAWHVGHADTRVPRIVHYDLLSHVLCTDDALHPAKPRRLPTQLARRTSGRIYAMLKALEEPTPMLWFRWADSPWDLRGIPHLGTFVPRPGVETPKQRQSLGLVRFVAPAYVAKRRWCDYTKANKTAWLLQSALRQLGDPTQWLATDAAVPFAAMDAIEVWRGDAWVAVSDVPEAELDAMAAR